MRGLVWIKLRAAPKVLLSVLRRGTQQTAKMNKAKTTNLFAAGESRAEQSRAERERSQTHTKRKWAKLSSGFAQRSARRRLCADFHFSRLTSGGSFCEIYGFRRRVLNFIKFRIERVTVKRNVLLLFLCIIIFLAGGRVYDLFSILRRRINERRTTRWHFAEPPQNTPERERESETPSQKPPPIIWCALFFIRNNCSTHQHRDGTNTHTPIFHLGCRLQPLHVEWRPLLCWPTFSRSKTKCPWTCYTAFFKGLRHLTDTRDQKIILKLGSRKNVKVAEENLKMMKYLKICYDNIHTR